MFSYTQMREFASLTDLYRIFEFGRSRHNDNGMLVRDRHD